MSWVIRFCTAVRFLTLIPVSWRAEEDALYFSKSVVFFPLVGLLIGFGGYLLAQGCRYVFPPEVSTFLVLAYLSGISGGLHLDGLADSGDGMLAPRSKEQRLSIMKDSRLGAMGAIVLVFVLLGKYSALGVATPEILGLFALIMPMAGRCCILVVMAAAGYGRKKEKGVGGLFYDGASRLLAAGGLGFLLLVSWLIFPQRALALILTLLIVSVLFARFCTRSLGGATGDSLGAICELGELVTAIVLSSTVNF